MLKKICDHPFILTKRAAEDVLEGIDSMLNRDELNTMEEMVSRIANMMEPSDTKDVDNSVSCKISFLLSLLVRQFFFLQIIVLLNYLLMSLCFCDPCMTGKVDSRRAFCAYILSNT